MVDKSKEDYEKPFDLVRVEDGDDLQEAIERQITDRIGSPVCLTNFRRAVTRLSTSRRMRRIQVCRRAAIF